jgi:hypothetical protein
LTGKTRQPVPSRPAVDSLPTLASAPTPHSVSEPPELATIMISSKRVRWLVVALAAAIIIAVLFDGGLPTLAGRDSRPSTEHDRLAARLRSLRVEWERIEIAQARLTAAGATSLPPDPEVAASLWQSAILGEARAAGLNEVTVTPLNHSPEGELVHRVTLDIRTAGSLAKLGSFLDRVLALPPHTRIDSLSLTPVASPSGPVEDRFRLDLSVAALSLSGTPPRHELVVAGSGPRPVSPTTNEFASLLPAVDRFPQIPNDSPTEEPTESLGPEEQTPTPTGPAELLAGTRLLAAWHEGPVSEAWFHETPGNVRHTVRPGQSFQLGDSEVRLVSIGSGACVVEVDGAARSVRLGQSLGDGLVQ